MVLMVQDNRGDDHNFGEQYGNVYDAWRVPRNNEIMIRELVKSALVTMELSKFRLERYVPGFDEGQISVSHTSASATLKTMIGNFLGSLTRLLIQFLTIPAAISFKVYYYT